MGTLTYAGAGCHDPRRSRAHVGAFFKCLRDALGGDAFPYAWVPEWHKSGHGLHLHFAVGQFIARGLIEKAWPHGFVHIKRLSGAATGSLGQARLAAGYLSKYVAKSFGDADAGRRPAGLHRFDVAQGFTPVPVLVEATSLEGLVGAACEVMGSAPVRLWNSDQVEGWKAPPSLWLQWGHRG